MFGVARAESASLALVSAFCCARSVDSAAPEANSSASGVGSAANAKLGLIVGYVGASHIADKEGHAKMLLAGKRSDDGRGADVVIEDMADLPPLVAAFAAGGVEQAKGCATAGPRWLA